MKIALLDNTLHRSGGDVTWTRTIREELKRRDGVELDHFRMNYYKSYPDVIKLRKKTPEELHGFLRDGDYDRILVPEAIHREQDAYFADVLPEYRDRVVGSMHASVSWYDRSGGFEADRFFGSAARIWLTRKALLEDHRPEGVTFKELPHLPYQPQYYAPLRHRQGVLYTGRIAAYKGHSAFARIMHLLDTDVTIQGRAMMAGARGMLNRVLKNVPDAEVTIEPEGKKFQSPWQVRLPNGYKITYVGPYDHPNEILWDQATVHVNLTDPSCSPEHLEYSTVEAIDAGLRCVVPERHLAGLDYGTVRGAPFFGPKDYDADGVVDTIKDALFHGPPPREDRERDLAKHDVKSYVDGVFGW